MLDKSFEFMSKARDHPGDAPREHGRFHSVFPGKPLSVRTTLNAAMQALGEMGIADDQADVVEIVLAEVLNNVVEHAYGEHGRGEIELEVARQTNALTIVIRDDGRPMPDGNTPSGRPQDLDVRAENLPEGGFGWLLIRQLTRDLTYRRSGNRNELRFVIPLVTNMGN